VFIFKSEPESDTMNSLEVDYVHSLLTGSSVPEVQQDLRSQRAVCSRMYQKVDVLYHYDTEDIGRCIVNVRNRGDCGP
jgi:hypothetical protein